MLNVTLMRGDREVTEFSFFDDGLKPVRSVIREYALMQGFDQSELNSGKIYARCQRGMGKVLGSGKRRHFFVDLQSTLAVDAEHAMGHLNSMAIPKLVAGRY